MVKVLSHESLYQGLEDHLEVCFEEPEAAGSLYALALLDITDDTGATHGIKRRAGTIGCNWIQMLRCLDDDMVGRLTFEIH